MPATLKEWAEERGTDAETIAADLTTLLGREITAEQVGKRWGGTGRNVPKAWAEALGAELDPPEPGSEPPPRQRRRRAAEQDPSPPTPALPIDMNVSVLQVRIAGIYVLVGKGVGAATKDARYAVVFEQHADQAAAAWVELAKQDHRVARVLEAMMVGGPWSGVIWTHLSLGMSLVMLSGRVQFPAFPGPPPAAGPPADAPPPPEPPPNGPVASDAAESLLGDAREQASP